MRSERSSSQNCAQHNSTESKTQKKNHVENVKVLKCIIPFFQPPLSEQLMLRAATHSLNLGAQLVSLAPGFSPVKRRTPISLSSAALARRKRGTAVLKYLRSEERS